MEDAAWRIISDWYSATMSSVRISSTLSNPSPKVLCRDLYSHLSYSWLLSTPYCLTLKQRMLVYLFNYGTFVGAAAHADDVITIASSKKTIIDQAKIIENFTSNNYLKLNSSKLKL